MAGQKKKTSGAPRYQQIYDTLNRSIISGEYKPGQRLPSEIELCKRFETSRITVAKALNELRKHGLLSRRAGSGTTVNSLSKPDGHVFGLLIPDPDRSESFDSICHGIMRSPFAYPHTLLWGPTEGVPTQQEQDALNLCEYYITKKVSGVFFAPLEYTPRMGVVNRRIVASLQRCRIPIVLLDRCYMAYPSRSKYDLVGIDNQRAGFGITDHLLRLGLTKIAFLIKPFSASNVDGRAAGWREAHIRFGMPCDERFLLTGDPRDSKFVFNTLQELRPQGFVCATDLTAISLMQTLYSLGVTVPEQIRVVGLDDLRCSGSLPIPLTTQHQDYDAIGAAAMMVMLDRLANPDLPTRDVLHQSTTLVRESCGSKLGKAEFDSKGINSTQR